MRGFDLALSPSLRGQSGVPKSAELLLTDKTGFQDALLGWFQVHQRRLPWRESPSLYKTVVSEFMLQQTQVKTVLPYFARWMEAFPSFAVLAAGSEAEVLKRWEGLGYYSRARNLHRLAQAVAALPAPPKTAEAWRELPGVGPYTAAAVTSMAFGAQEACVDGNVVRILARLTADETEFRDSASAAKVFTPLANVLLSPKNPGDHNQAMMELGATICHRQNPLCTVCPVYAFCAAAKKGEPEAFPRLAAKKFEQQTVLRAWCVQDGKLLLHRADAAAKRLANLHELPTPAHLGLDESTLGSSELLARKKRGITRYQITELIYAVDLSKTPHHQLFGGSTLHWIPIEKLDTITLSGPHRRWVTELLTTKASVQLLK